MSIAFKTPFSLPMAVSVPLALHQKVDDVLDHGRSVSVVRKVDGRQRTVNSFSLTSDDGPRPKETTEEVAQAVADIMQHDTLAALHSGHHDLVAAGIEYVVKVRCFSGQRAKTFSWSWRLDDIEDDEDDEPDALDDAEVPENSHPYLHGIIEMQNRHQERLMYRLDQAHRAMILSIDRQQKPLEMIGAQLNFAQGILMQGMQALVSSVQMNYSAEATKQAEAAKSERLEKILGALNTHLGPALKVGGMQLSTWLGKKMRGEAGPVPRGRDIVRETATNMAAGAPSSGPVPPGAPPSPVVMPDPPPPVSENPDDIGDPLQHCIAAFSESLRPAQRKEIRRQFSADALDAFDDFLDSPTGEIASQRFATLQAKLEGDLSPLMDLLGGLTENQQQLATHIVAACLGASAADS